MTKKLSIVILLLAAIGAGAYYFTRNEEVKEPVLPKVAVNELPYLNFITLDGAHVIAHDLPGKTILIMFNTDCDHCQREAQEISEKLGLFRDYTLYFLASEPVESIQKFAGDYKLADRDHVIFGRAEVSDVVETFGPIATPSFYIFSQEKRLVKYFNGETKVADLVNFL